MTRSTIDRRTFLTAAAFAPAAGAVSATSIDTRCWQIGAPGGFETMRLVDRSLAPPAASEVVVEVTTSAIAARDLGIVQGWFLEDKPPHLIPLSEGVGVVVAAGEQVTHVRPGDRVVCVHFAGWVDGPWTPDNYRMDVGNTIDGWLGEHVVLPASGVTRVPDAVTDDTAATMSGSGITAWHALHEVGRVKSGDLVLTLGTGGVSSWGLLLAKAAGARVAVTSSSDEKLDLMRTLGADITINYRRHPDWGERLLADTGGQGADIVLENVGRATLDQSMHACANNAMIVMIGTGRLPDELPRMPGLYIRNLALKAISNGSRSMMDDMLRAVAANGIDALVARAFEFADAVEAFQFMARSGHAGKVIIRHA